MLALLARGREAGVAVLLATQELADLDRAAPGFRDQVLGIISVKLAHRQDVPASARMIAEMIGTERVWEETRDLQSPFGRRTASRGTRREVERYVVAPQRDQVAADRPGGDDHQDSGGARDAGAGAAARQRSTRGGAGAAPSAPSPRGAPRRHGSRTCCPPSGRPPAAPRPLPRPVAAVLARQQPERRAGRRVSRPRPATRPTRADASRSG